MIIGGSTILLLFEPGMMVFDDDLVDNSNGALETLVGVESFFLVAAPRLTRYTDPSGHVNRTQPRSRTVYS